MCEGEPLLQQLCKASLAFYIRRIGIEYNDYVFALCILAQCQLYYAFSIYIW